MWCPTSVTFADLVDETLKRWKECDTTNQRQQQQQDTTTTTTTATPRCIRHRHGHGRGHGQQLRCCRLHFHLWKHSLGRLEWDLLADRLEQENLENVPLELYLSDCALDPQAIPHLCRFIHHDKKLFFEALHLVDLTPSLEYHHITALVTRVPAAQDQEQQQEQQQPHSLKELTLTVENKPGLLNVLQACGSSLEKLTLDGLRCTIDTQYIQELTTALKDYLPRLRSVALQRFAVNDASLALIVPAILTMGPRLRDFKLDLTTGHGSLEAAEVQQQQQPPPPKLTYASLPTLTTLFRGLPSQANVRFYAWNCHNLLVDADAHMIDALATALAHTRARIRVLSFQDVGGLQSWHLSRLLQALEHVGNNTNNNNTNGSKQENGDDDDHDHEEEDHDDFFFSTEVEFTGKGFFQGVSGAEAFEQLLNSLTRMTGITKLEIDDEAIYDDEDDNHSDSEDDHHHHHPKWDLSRDERLLAALQRNPCLESFSLWTGTTDRIDLYQRRSNVIFQRNKTLRQVSKYLRFKAFTATTAVQCWLPHALAEFSTQAGPYGADPILQILRHSFTKVLVSGTVTTNNHSFAVVVTTLHAQEIS